MPLKIFVASEKFPRPDTSSGCRRFFAILEYLCRTHDVTLLVNRPRNLDDEYRLYADRLIEAGIKGIVTDFYIVDRLMASQRFDLGIIEFHTCDPAVVSAFRASQPGSVLIVDSVDIHFLRHAMELSYRNISEADFHAEKQKELNVYRESDGVIVVSEEDAEGLKNEIPDLRTWLVPNIVPLQSRPQKERDKELLFVGGFRHSPNVDGILWFANQVWPMIKAGCDEARLAIVGSSPPKNVQNLADRPGIKVFGYVPETQPFLDRAAVSVAPLLTGAGMKGKVTEALAAGTPVVTTTIGAQGFNAISGQHLRIADEGHVFAEHVLALLHNPCEAEKMGANGRELVAGICSPDAVQLQLDRFLDQAASLPRPMGRIAQRKLYQLSILRSTCAKLPRKLLSFFANR